MSDPVGGVGSAALVWGVKSSFVRYVSGMSDGAIVLADGAIRRGDEFMFPLRSHDGSVYRFDGSVTFSGHFGMLNLVLAEVRVETSGDAVSLSIADDDADGDDEGEGGGAGDGRIVWVEGRVAPGSHSTALRLDQLALTAAGAELFFDTYRRGESFEPAEIVWS